MLCKVLRRWLKGISSTSHSKEKQVEEEAECDRVSFKKSRRHQESTNSNESAIRDPSPLTGEIQEKETFESTLITDIFANARSDLKRQTERIQKRKPSNKAEYLIRQVEEKIAGRVSIELKRNEVDENDHGLQHSSENTDHTDAASNSRTCNTNWTPSELNAIFERSKEKIEIENLREYYARVVANKEKLIELGAETMVAFEVFMEINQVEYLKALDGRDQLDFHGLSIRRAKIIAEWIATLLLPSRGGRIEIITGYGKNSENITGHGQNPADQKSTLKTALKKYFTQTLELYCDVSSDNPGVLVISS